MRGFRVKVKAIARQQVVTARPVETIVIAAQRMASRNVGSLVVIDDREVPVGIITDRDVALKVIGTGSDPATTTVEDVMSREPTAIDEEASLETVLGVMSRCGVRRLPVVGLNGELTSVVSLDDVHAQLVDILHSMSGLYAQQSPERYTQP